MRAEFEWGLVQTPQGWEIHERLVGSDLLNIYSLPTREAAEAVVKARRAFVNRTITTRLQAMQVFEPRPNLEALKKLQSKGHLDS